MRVVGLSSAEAAESCQKWGDNRLSEQESRSFWAALGENFADPMIKILCAALFINIVLVVASMVGWIPDKVAWYEPAGIAAAILLATVVSTFSEYKNENAFRKLQDEASRIHCKVYRDGEVCELPIDDIVQGDVVLLQTGDKIPADGFLIEGRLQLDQAVLNGESNEAEKTAAPDLPPPPPLNSSRSVKDSASYIDADNSEKIDFLHPHKVYRGAVVVQGSALMRVSVVGEKSVYGGIAKELQTEDDRETPLKVKLGALANGISKFGYAGGVVIALALLFQRIVIAQHFDIQEIVAYCLQWTHLLNDVIHAVMLAVIIIVMAVPEGLPLMIAIVSALNMGKMLKDNVLVRKISGIETAGSLNILFSDKTGTITRGKLEVIGFFSGTKEYGAFTEIEEGLKPLLSLSLFANSGALLSGVGKERRAIGGNGTERALLNFAAESSGVPEGVHTAEKILFNSKNKFSAVEIMQPKNDISKNNTSQNNILENDVLTLIKGAPEKIILRCTHCLDAQGKVIPFDSRDKINKKIDELAERSIRVVALAVSPCKIADAAGGIAEILPPDAQWVFAGIVGIRDEVRPESIEAIAEVQNAGVRVVMITGDRKETAVSIAKEAGLLTQNDDITLSSDELSALSDDEVKEKLPRIKVIARALPSDKSRLVRIAQELGFVTGMTGDGVNDSPALKKADVGFAMGGGTEVAKEASEIVILDDNFSSIDKAILYGRTIFNSIRKFIVFQLTINVSAVLITFIAPLFGQPNPLSITQILWINLIMDTLAALAFGGESALRRFMREAPKRRDEAIVSPAMWSAIISGALWVFALSCLYLFTPFFSGFFPPVQNGDVFHTGYFAMFVFCAVFNAFNARTEKINLFDNIGGNKGFLHIIAIIVVVQVLLIYLGREVFQCFGLNAAQWKIVLALAVTIVPVDMLRKALSASKNIQTNSKSFLLEKRSEKLLKRYEENNQRRG